MDFCAFDADYISRLTAEDPDAEAHFSAYFTRFIALKLHSRRVAPEMVEDVRQETLMRVLNTLRKGNGISQPERFGAFVNSVCRNVLLELSHKQARHPAIDENTPELSDDSVDLDRTMMNEERRRMVAEVLDDLSAKDREILRLIFFEEADRDKICSRMSVDANYLRVLLHRAKSRFETAYRRKYQNLKYALLLCCNGIAARLIISTGAY